MWLTEMQKEEEAFFFFKGGGRVNFHIDILEIQMQSKILGAGGGECLKKKASRLVILFLVDCAIGMVILKEGDLYELQ